MPKKTGRAARSQQNILKRSNVIHPLVDRTAVIEPETDVTQASDVTFSLPEEKVQILAEPPAFPLEKKVSETEQVKRATPTRTVLPSGKPLPRRFSNNSLPKLPGFTRAQEYSFIRSDLITVSALTVLMIAVLVTLAVILAR